MQKQIHKQDRPGAAGRTEKVKKSPPEELQPVQHRPEVAGLIETVKNGSIYSSLKAAGELKHIGEDAVDPLMAAFKDSETNAIRWRIAMALARLGDVAVDDLIKV
ncbi:MAG: hypothetical protein D5R96_06420, partial [Methanocalculus sp. MSAO_Arc2]